MELGLVGLGRMGGNMRTRLRNAGHTPDVVPNGSLVVPRLIEHPAALVLLDLMLPGMDGLLVCQAIRQEPRTAATPIVMFRSASAPTTSVIARRAAANPCSSASTW